MIGNESKGMKVIGYLNPPKAEDHTLAPGIIFAMIEIQDACQQCLQNGFQNILQNMSFAFHGKDSRRVFSVSIVTRTLDYSNVSILK